MAIVSVGAAAIIVAAALIAANSVHLQEQQVPARGAAAFDRPISEIIARQSVKDSQEASSLVGYPAKMPTSLPQDYTIQMTTVQPEEKIVTMLASPSEIKSGITTHSQFFNEQKGILIYIEELDPKFDKETWLKEWANERSATLTTIQGYQAAVHEILTHDLDGEVIQEPAEIIVLKDNTEIELRGMVSISDLVNAAESML